MSSVILTYVLSNTYLCPQQYLPMSSVILTCVLSNTYLCPKYLKIEKEFFGPIDAERKKNTRNLHVTPPSPLQSPLEFDFLKTSAVPRKLRFQREIRRDNNLKKQLKLSNTKMKIAETDLTAHVVVFPMIEISPSNTSSNVNKAINEESHIISICLSSLDMLLLLGTIIILFGASCLITMLFIRHKQFCCITSVMDDDGICKRRPINNNSNNNLW
ncbi:unnamed protein product [Brugia pahangi]|uniref:ZP domain-containing protein n=1 Tax=Brugia pahangi TaxID=6280 RepID=A0A0N4TBF0_BRUPA|nr:unnamed protein product [Brugia pahangi]